MSCLKKIIFCSIAFLFICLGSIAFAEEQTNLPAKTDADNSLKEILQAIVNDNKKSDDPLFPPKTAILNASAETDSAIVNFSSDMSVKPIRPATLKAFDALFMPALNPNNNKKFKVKYLIKDKDIAEFIPRSFLTGKDKARYVKKENNNPPLVRKSESELPDFKNGLAGKNLVLWASHGWYFDETASKRWEWQRPRMFTIAEDTHNMAMVNQFLIPMLENAGAYVFSARERDFQKNEVVVDNDDVLSSSASVSGIYLESGVWKNGEGKGFRNGLSPYELNFNPHEQGTNRIALTSEEQTASVTWIPDIPEDGVYAVTISYKHDKEKSANDAHYAVFHRGGKTEFLVNQTMGGGTWIYLGTFRFKKGINKECGSVVLTNQSSQSGKIVSADAARFGGGMGSVKRGGNVSGYPRYLEGALYWMQYAGAPPDLVYNLGLDAGVEGPDYTNDFAGRGEFANWLNGKPAGPNKDRDNPGLGIPIDMSLAIHTDAGVTTGVVGFLSIYRAKDGNDSDVFPDGRSRMLNRELADLIQTEAMNVIHSKYSTTFTSRELRDSDYSESRRPNIPCALLEMLSHQNYNDMKYYLDPRFRFDLARGIYKGILKFIANEYGFEPIVQPLPPKEMSLRKLGEDTAILSWSPSIDPIEPSSEPIGYMIYRREGDKGFSEGVFVKKTAYTLKKLDPRKIYSVKVTAVNEGGESFPSEILSICIGEPDAKRILVVNGFDRISAPAMTAGESAGFRRDIDRGVGYMAYYGVTGDQWDFDPKSEFRTNDHPGHGASFGDVEDKIEIGNTFDFTSIHGEAIAASGYGFDSASSLAVVNQTITLDDYPAVDWILGEQKETLPPIGFFDEGQPDKMVPEFKTFNDVSKKIISDYLNSGGKFFTSGAYIALDLEDSKNATDADKKFLNDVLKAKWSTNFGSKTNNVYSAFSSPLKPIPDFHFASGIGENGVYGVENPNAIEPADKSAASVVFRYKDAGFSAGIAFKDEKYACVVLGFPFETITDCNTKKLLMAEILEYLLK